MGVLAGTRRPAGGEVVAAHLRVATTTRVVTPGDLHRPHSRRTSPKRIMVRKSMRMQTARSRRLTVKLVSLVMMVPLAESASQL